MAEICPNCNGTDVQQNFQGGYCLSCGRSLAPSAEGDVKDKGEQVLDLPGPADTSLATATATPVYAEQEKDRQPAVDTNIQAVPSKAAPGPNEKPAPDLEAMNVAGELSDETPQEKKAGGPDDQPRTAELTKTGSVRRSTKVLHSTDDEGADSVAPVPDEDAAPTDAHADPTGPRLGDPAPVDKPKGKR